jgi:hypothetical protein
VTEIAKAEIDIEMADAQIRRIAEILLAANKAIKDRRPSIERHVGTKHVASKLMSVGNRRLSLAWLAVGQVESAIDEMAKALEWACKP